MSAGRAEFERRDGERQRLAGRLMEASHAPLLSILIQGLARRDGPLDDLLAGLRRQLQERSEPPDVEVLIEVDAGERSAGAKRKSLLARARGKWVAFIDDGDVIADDSTTMILRALEQDPDGVTFGGSKASNGPAFSGGTRVFAVRRSIVLAAARRRDMVREDLTLSGAFFPFLKSEVRIDQTSPSPRRVH